MRPGDVIDDRFELERLAGSGGMGDVFRARDRHTGDKVALKILIASQAPERLRFAREARVLAELSHSGIVRYIADGTTTTGQAYLAMEWLDGEELRARLSREGLTLEE